MADKQLTSRGGVIQTFRDNTDGSYADEHSSQLRAWDAVSLTWVKVQVDHTSGALSTTGGAGGAGGGGAATIADGADVAQGTTTDAAWVSGSGTVISLLKKIASAGGSAVSVADGADVAQGTTSDASSANTVVGLLKAIKAAITGTLTVGTHAVTQSGGPWTVDTELPAAAALADATANPSAPATAAFGLVWNGASWDRVPGSAAAGMKVQSAQLPAALAANGGLKVEGVAGGVAVPVSLAAAPTTAVTGPLTDAQLRAAAVPVSGTVTANQGGAPWSENLSQVGGTAITAKAVPANADGQVAIPVYVNAQQYATYDIAMRNIATGVLTTNTAKPVMSFEHALASTKTVRIRRIMIHALQTTALAGAFDVQIMKGTAASSAGTALTPNPRKGSDPAAEMVVKSLPTIVAATLGDIIPAGGFATTTTLYSPPVLVYDWQESGETKPLMLRAGVLESIVINIISVQALNLTLTVSVDFTEE